MVNGHFCGQCECNVHCIVSAFSFHHLQNHNAVQMVMPITHIDMASINSFSKGSSFFNVRTKLNKSASRRRRLEMDSRDSILNCTDNKDLFRISIFGTSPLSFDADYDYYLIVAWIEVSWILVMIYDIFSYLCF